MKYKKTNRYGQARVLTFFALKSTIENVLRVRQGVRLIRRKELYSYMDAGGSYDSGTNYRNESRANYS
ncbi:hypothetical protein SPIRO4BDMA_70305 [uncultured spirochete]|uniref:Uncharacterized protein n=1 Tax=uncultured spirochete TaxID=156406 RepID=A0A3P3XUA8_9SPIR|nr:hypothetical protein SPIRO4BDMA_70305 [uncultured spirochete]